MRMYVDVGGALKVKCLMRKIEEAVRRIEEDGWDGWMGERREWQTNKLFDKAVYCMVFEFVKRKVVSWDFKSRSQSKYIKSWSIKLEIWFTNTVLAHLTSNIHPALDREGLVSSPLISETIGKVHFDSTLLNLFSRRDRSRQVCTLTGFQSLDHQAKDHFIRSNTQTSTHSTSNPYCMRLHIRNNGIMSKYNTWDDRFSDQVQLVVKYSNLHIWSKVLYWILKSISVTQFHQFSLSFWCLPHIKIVYLRIRFR